MELCPVSNAGVADRGGRGVGTPEPSQSTRGEVVSLHGMRAQTRRRWTVRTQCVCPPVGPAASSQCRGQTVATDPRQPKPPEAEHATAGGYPPLETSAAPVAKPPRAWHEGRLGVTTYPHVAAEP